MPANKQIYYVKRFAHLIRQVSLIVHVLRTAFTFSVFQTFRPAEKLNPAETFELRHGKTPELNESEVLVRTVYLSLDPAMVRFWHPKSTKNGLS